MRMTLISLIVVACIGLCGSESKQTKAQFNKQIAILESKVFTLENENKKLKTEVSKKDKVISALAMRLAGQPVKANTRSRTNNNSRGYNVAEARRKASQLAAEQQKKQRTRQLSIIVKKIKYYEKQKSDINRQYAEASKKIKDAKYIMGKSRRKEATREALESQNKIKSKISNIDYNIDALKNSVLIIFNCDKITNKRIILCLR